MEIALVAGPVDKEEIARLIPKRDIQLPLPVVDILGVSPLET